MLEGGFPAVLQPPVQLARVQPPRAQVAGGVDKLAGCRGRGQQRGGSRAAACERER